MSTTVSYKGGTITTVNNNTKILETAGTYLEDDITLVDVTESGDEYYLWQDNDGYIQISETMPYANVNGSVLNVPGNLMRIGVIEQITSMDGSTLNVAEGFLERQNYVLILEWDGMAMEGSVIYGDYADVKGILDVGGTPVIKAIYTDSEGETSEVISSGVYYESSWQEITIIFQNGLSLGLFSDNRIVLE